MEAEIVPLLEDIRLFLGGIFGFVVAILITIWSKP